MSHREHNDHENASDPARTHRHGPMRRLMEGRMDEPEGSFITRDDLSNFLSIKPYLSEKAQAIVDLLSEMHRTGGRLDAQSIARLLSIVGANNQNLPVLASLAGLAGAASSGKFDPSTLLSVLGNLNQPQPEQPKEKEEEP